MVIINLPPLSLTSFTVSLLVKNINKVGKEKFAIFNMGSHFSSTYIYNKIYYIILLNITSANGFSTYMYDVSVKSLTRFQFFETLQFHK